MYYALDLMGPSGEKRYAQGRVIIMLYCDDFLMGSHCGGLCATDADNLKGRLAPNTGRIFDCFGSRMAALLGQI